MTTSTAPAIATAMPTPAGNPYCHARYGYDLDGWPVRCCLMNGHDGAHVNVTNYTPTTLEWED